MENKFDLIVVGGGAAGFFCAIQLAQQKSNLKILILEKSNKVLSKVKISGGGRCNVTHACFDPNELIEFYPRGKKELRGPFHQFLCGDMMAWLSDHGVETKIESDGRVFPVSNRSQDIIDCFLNECERHKIDIRLSSAVTEIKQQRNKTWDVFLKDQKLSSTYVLFATGSSPAAWKIIEKLDHKIVPPVPSLFTFNIQSPLLADLPGISVPDAQIKLVDLPFSDNGPLLITHWGLSGPAILKISAWAARELNERKYKFEVEINWTDKSIDEIKLLIQAARTENGKQLLMTNSLFGLPKRLWQKMINLLKLQDKNYASLASKDMNALINMVGAARFKVNGKSTFKDEFVTCGGIATKEINFKTMESKLHEGLYLAGEVNNIDAVTGGYNFQACWTEGYLAAKAIAGKLTRA